MIGCVVTGAAGRMGGEIVKAVRDDAELTLVAGTEAPGHAAIGRAVGLAARLGRMEAPTVDSLDKALALGARVVIDFTSPEASAEHAAICRKHKVALVVGSTGFSAEAKAAVAQASADVPIVMAPNMSIGVNLMFRLAREAARVLGDAYDPEIFEIHHKHKKDAPSGTALRLAEVVAEAMGRDLARDGNFGRRGAVGERPPKQIGVQTLRGGDVVGEHTALFLGEGERLEITHRATSRDQFARGAVRAARWAVDRAPGLYDMQDVLGFR